MYRDRDNARKSKSNLKVEGEVVAKMTCDFEQEQT